MILRTAVVFSTDRSKAVPLFHFFFFRVSVVSYVTLVLSLFASSCLLLVPRESCAL